MTARAAFKQADVERALRAADAVGLKVAGFRIVPGTGEIAVEVEGATVKRTNPLDRFCA